MEISNWINQQHSRLLAHTRANRLWRCRVNLLHLLEQRISIRRGLPSVMRHLHQPPLKLVEQQVGGAVEGGKEQNIANGPMIREIPQEAPAAHDQTPFIHGGFGQGATSIFGQRRIISRAAAKRIDHGNGFD